MTVLLRLTMLLRMSYEKTKKCRSALNYQGLMKNMISQSDVDVKTEVNRKDMLGRTPLHLSSLSGRDYSGEGS